MLNSDRLVLAVCLCGALFLSWGCAGSNSGQVSPDEAKAKAQAQIDEINKRTDIPPAAKEQIIGHIQQSLRMELAPPKAVTGRRGSGGS